LGLNPSVKSNPECAISVTKIRWKISRILILVLWWIIIADCWIIIWKVCPVLFPAVTVLHYDDPLPNRKNVTSQWYLGNFWATVCKMVRPMLSVRCLSVCPVCLSVCDVGVLWSNSWMVQDETWHGGRPRPQPHCVRWGPSSPSPKEHSPHFLPISVVAKLLYRSRCHLVRR